MPKKSNPSVDAQIILVLNGEGDGDDALIELVEGLTDEYDGLDVQILAPIDADADDDESDDDEDGTDDGEDDEDGDEDAYTEEELNDLGTDDLKGILEEWELSIDGRFSKAKAIAAILEAQDADEDDDESDEDDDEDGDDEDVMALAEAADDGDEEASDRLYELCEDAGIDANDFDSWADVAEALTNGDDEDDEDVLDEDDLNAMSTADLKKLHKEVVGKAPARGMAKAALIEAILDAAEAED